MSGPHIRHPIPHRFVDRLLQRRLAGCHRDNLRVKEFHARNIESLTLHVDLAHIDHTLTSEARGHCSGSDAMLTRSGFGDDSSFTHPPREEDLTESIVNLVRAGMKQVLSFQIDPGAAELA